jgi:FkbM family methyltransferase
MLLSNLKLNGRADNVRSINVAVSASEKKLEIYRAPVTNLGMTSTFKRRHRRSQFEAEVDALSLENILNLEELQNARLIKIDIEGNEKGALASVKTLLRRCRRDVEFLIELSPGLRKEQSSNAEEALKELLNDGFNAFVINDFNNKYHLWHYLWPNVDPNLRQLSRDDLKSLKRKVDLVLSRDHDLAEKGRVPALYG